VEVILIDDSLVRVRFQEDSALEDGWIPFEVLQSSKLKSVKLKVKNVSKQSDCVSVKEHQRKLDSLDADKQQLEHKNEQLEKDFLGSTQEVSRLKTENARLREGARRMKRNHANEQARLKEQVDKDRDQILSSILALEEMERTHVEKKIQSLGALLEGRTIGELLEASKIVQQQIEEATTRLQEDKRRAIIAKERAEDQNICVICKVEEKTHTFRPCGHFCVCADCSSQVQSCPLCRRRIRGVDRTFSV